MKKHSKNYHTISRLFYLFNIKYEIKYLIRTCDYTQHELSKDCHINTKQDNLSSLNQLNLAKLKQIYNTVNMIYAEELINNLLG